MPSLAGDEELRKFYRRLERASASPAAAWTLSLISHGTDVRHVLPPVLAGLKLIAAVAALTTHAPLQTRVGIATLSPPALSPPVAHLIEAFNRSPR